MTDLLRGVQQLAADPNPEDVHDRSWQVTAFGPHPTLADHVVVTLTHESGRTEAVLLDLAMGDPDPDYAEWWDYSANALDVVQWLRICRHVDAVDRVHEMQIGSPDAHAVQRLREDGYYDFLRKGGYRVDSVDAVT